MKYNYIFNIIFQLINFCLFFYFLKKFDYQRNKKRSIWLLPIFLIFVYFSFEYYFPYMTIFILFAVYFIAYYIYETDKKDALFITITWYVILTLSLLIPGKFGTVNILLDSIYRSNPALLLSEKMYYISQCLRLFIFALFMLFLVLISKNIKEYIFKHPTFKNMLILTLPPIFFIAMIFEVVSGFFMFTGDSQYYTLILIALDFLVLFAIQSFISSQNLSVEVNKLNTKDKMNKLSYNLIMDKYNSNRKYIHDFSKHVNILKELSDKEDYEQLKLYIQSMNEDSQKMKNETDSGNKTIDLVVSTAMSKYEYQNIKLLYEKIDEVNFKNEYLYQIVSILYNVIENAVESCIRCEGGSIKIKCHKSDTSYFVIRIRNTSLPVDVKNLKTSKTNGYEHGIGLMSIEDEVKKLNGEFKISFDEETNEFCTYILLPNSLLV